MTTMFNGKLVSDPQVSIFSDAVMRGFGVFETLRTYNGKVFELESHLLRLFDSADEIGLEIAYCFEEIAEMVLDCVEACDTGDMMRVKVFVYTGGGFGDL